MGLQGFNFLIIFAVSTSYTPKMRCCELRKVNHEVTAFYDHAPGVVVKSVPPPLASAKVTVFYDHAPGVVVKVRTDTFSLVLQRIGLCTSIR